MERRALRRWGDLERNQVVIETEGGRQGLQVFVHVASEQGVLSLVVQCHGDVGQTGTFCTWEFLLEHLFHLAFEEIACEDCLAAGCGRIVGLGYDHKGRILIAGQGQTARQKKEKKKRGRFHGYSNLQWGRSW